MDDKKERIHVTWDSWFIMSSVRFPFLVFKSGDFCIDALADNFHVDEDDNIEEESDEDKDDAAEDPNGKRSQSRRIGGGGGKGRVEHVHQNLLIVCTVVNL